ncbi:MAG: bifunctional phosphopantothenoylcysteine decarboxylase/phosphopantothenate--cysteine ligase CoaBC [Aristaeellaceae bacterium]
MSSEALRLTGKTVVLGVTGGIAAYKACEVVSRLRKLGAEVYVVMTHNACAFVQPLTFETLSNHPVVTDTFARPETWEVEHIALAKRADVFAIAPATANILAKMACGIADDMLSTTVLATKAPVLVAPAMNTGMWTAQVTQENCARLRARGVRFVGPDAGFLACGDTGAGRMSEPAAIVEAIGALLCPVRDMAGLRVLVTAGATRERLDPVRYMTNDSSGKMGFAVAEAAAKRGASVTVVAGSTTAAAPGGVNMVRVESTQELYDAVTALAPEMDVVIQAAAPADYRFAVTYQEKHKKAHDGQPFVVELVENPDIAAAVGAAKRPGQTLVGFAAETENLHANASAKLAKKNLDLIVANDVSQPGAGFNVDTNIATLITRDGMTECPLRTKKELAEDILNKVMALRHP